LIYKIYVILFIYIRVLIKESAMNTMLRWSPTRQFHFHHDGDNQFDRFLGRATDDVDQGSSWLPAAEGGLRTVPTSSSFALPGVDPKDVKVTLMDNVLTVKGESKADHDTTGKDYFVREVVYGAFQRSFGLPDGVDAAAVEAKYTNGVLEVRVPAPRAATPMMIEVKAA